jgi:Nucleotidyl transferase AbiEii toxin, Type IV TA system
VDTSKLAPETKRVWEFLAGQQSLEGFTLVGGTALTLHLGHRISEDLDFVTVNHRLPRPRLNGLVRLAQEFGFHIESDDSQDAYEEFLIAGMSLHDYQQNFLVNGVKLNIFTAQSDLVAMLDSTGAPVPHPRVATLPELFRTKALASANRCASRDWLDLYILFQHGFTLDDFREAFFRPGILSPHQRIAQAFANLSRGIMPASDPGYATLLEEPPPITQISSFFSSMRDAYETAAVTEAFRQRGVRKI